MKIALFQPYVPDLNTMPSLGPLYLAAILEKEGFEVLFFDERIDTHVFRKTTSFRPDIFGVTAVTPAYPNGVDISRKIKTILPSTKVVFGGPHPSACPSDILSENGKIVDYVVIGEGEKTFLSLCKAIKDKNDTYEHLKSIKNLVFKDEKGSIHITGDEDLLSDDELDKIPYPAFHLMDLDRYFKGMQAHGIFQKGLKTLPIITTRGCPYTCTFCCRVMGKKVRKRSIDNVISELHCLIDRYNIDELYIEDDNPTIDKDRTMKLLSEIKKSKIKYLKFANGININTIDEEILQKMREAKVYSASFGIESGCERTLAKMRKSIDLKRAKRTISFAKSLGFLVGANCIIGYPEETIADIRESLNYFFSLSLDSMAIVNLVPFPGTEVRKTCEEKGYLTEEANDWGNYYFSINNPIPLIATPWLTKTQLVKEIKMAYRKMYFNISWIMKVLGNISLKKILIGIKAYFDVGIKKQDHLI